MTTITHLDAPSFQAAILAAQAAAHINSLRDLRALVAGISRWQAHRIDKAYRRELARQHRGLLAA